MSKQDRQRVSYLDDNAVSDTSIYDMNDLPYMSQARSLLLVLCAIMFFTASCVYMPLGNIQADHNGKCFLNTKVTFVMDTLPMNDTFLKSYNRLKIDIVDSQWGPVLACNFTTFTPVVVAILSMIIAWSTFTVWPTMMEIGKGGVLMLVYASLFTICLAATIASTVVLTRGYNNTCDLMSRVNCENLNTESVRLKAEGERIYVNDINRAIFIAEIASAGLIALNCSQILLTLGTFGIIWFHFHFISQDYSESLTDSEMTIDTEEYDEE